jgi:hypothetical protein
MNTINKAYNSVMGKQRQEDSKIPVSTGSNAYDRYMNMQNEMGEIAANTKVDEWEKSKEQSRLNNQMNPYSTVSQSDPYNQGMMMAEKSAREQEQLKQQTAGFNQGLYNNKKWY